MLFNDRILFIHVPKTGGMSVTRFLIENIPGPFTISLPKGHKSPSPDIDPIEGKRHERLADAARLLAKHGRTLDEFETILAVIRNPYDLEVSYYHYKRLGYKYDAGKAQNLALAGDFSAFARKAPYYGRLPARIHEWYEIDGACPPNLRILRFESLRSELLELVSRFGPLKHDLGRENTTRHGPFEEYLNAETEQAIYEKYRWLFDKGFYARQTFQGSDEPPRAGAMAGIGR